jgi:pimeloyl-ACP methyl ester carboxylesterase
MTSRAGQRSQPESAAIAGRAAATSQRASFTVTGLLIDVGDARLQIESAGTGTPPVIVETGHGALLLSWRSFRDLMCSERAVYLYDRPGHGQSTPTTGSSDAAAAADRLARLLTAAGVTEPVILVGHSAGALRAICFASRHPGRVAGLVLVDPSVPSPGARVQVRMLFEYARRTAGAAVRSLAMAWARARKQENPPDSNIAGRFAAGDRGLAAGYLAKREPAPGPQGREARHAREQKAGQHGRDRPRSPTRRDHQGRARRPAPPSGTRAGHHQSGARLGKHTNALPDLPHAQCT